MDSNIQTAYEYLTPADQQVIDVMILTLFKKSLEIKKLTDHIKESLDDEP